MGRTRRDGDGPAPNVAARGPRRPLMPLEANPMRYDTLRAQRDQAVARVRNILLAAEAEGRETLTVAETRRYEAARAEAEAANTALDEGEQEEQRQAAIASNPTLALLRRQQTPDRSAAMLPARRNDQSLVYRQGDNSTSWIRDLVRVQVGYDTSGESRRRLADHAEEVDRHPAYTEYRDLSRVDGQGGYAVPPAWLMDQYIELARPGRAFANLVQRQSLPGGTDSINIPKLLTGTATAIQTADNQPVADVDATDTYINAPVRTIAGQQTVAIQLIDQSPIAFDDVIFRDLVADHAAKTDLQVLQGSGVSGQVLGVDHTPGIGTVTLSGPPTIQTFYAALANAISQINVTRFLPPDCIVVHPRRWFWLASLLDTTNRPLVLPQGNNPRNAIGVLDNVASEQVVGNIFGLPVISDPNISVTASATTSVGTEDIAYVMRSRDLLLWESAGPRARVLPEVKAETLSVVLQIYGYLAFTAQRMPQSIVEIRGLSAPTF